MTFACVCVCVGGRRRAIINGVIITQTTTSLRASTMCIVSVRAGTGIRCACVRCTRIRLRAGPSTGNGVAYLSSPRKPHYVCYLCSGGVHTTVKPIRSGRSRARTSAEHTFSLSSGYICRIYNYVNNYVNPVQYS